MITKEQASSVLNPLGFELMSMSGNSKILNYANINNRIHVTVNTEKNTFQMVYFIPQSIMAINCPECSPFYEEQITYNQFSKIYSKFLIIVNNYKRGSYEL